MRILSLIFILLVAAPIKAEELILSREMGILAGTYVGPETCIPSESSELKAESRVLNASGGDDGLVSARLQRKIGDSWFNIQGGTFEPVSGSRMSEEAISLPFDSGCFRLVALVSGKWDWAYRLKYQ